MKKLILACTVSYIIQILSRVFCKSKHWIFMASIVKYYTLCLEMQLKVSVGTVSGVEHFAKLYNWSWYPKVIVVVPHFSFIWWVVLMNDMWLNYLHTGEVCWRYQIESWLCTLTVRGNGVCSSCPDLADWCYQPTAVCDRYKMAVKDRGGWKALMDWWPHEGSRNQVVVFGPTIIKSISSCVRFGWFGSGNLQMVWTRRWRWQCWRPWRLHRHW